MSTPVTAKPNTSLCDAAKVKICSGHTRPICHINYSDIIDGTFWFVTSCHDAKPMIRNGETGDWVGTFEGHKGAVYCSSFNSGATQLVTVSGDYTAKVWDAVTGKNLHTWEQKMYIKSCDWLEGKIATGNNESKVYLYDATAYNAEPTIINAHEKPTVKAVYFTSPSILISACESQIHMWDLRTQKVVKTRDIPGLNVLEYTHKHSMVAAHGKSITFLDPASLDETTTILTADDIECASLNPEGTLIAAGSKIKAKEFTLDGQELESHRGHHGPIFHIRWAPDGSMYSTGAEDGMVRMWPSHEIIMKYQD